MGNLRAKTIGRYCWSSLLLGLLLLPEGVSLLKRRVPLLPGGSYPLGQYLKSHGADITV